ncbi:MAG TPA: phosphopyruvate hydratase [Gammaproteobacteria bacterium]|nr:phosphopyruvate hydratase [Gammaproteobacteria bacterium]
MNKIKNIVCVEVLDSRGRPTIRCIMYSMQGHVAQATSPSGASCGSYEALELRDSHSDRYLGLGVAEVISALDKELIPHLLGFELGEQSLFDQQLIEIDGTTNKSRLGANSLLAISLAYAKLSSLVDQNDFYKSLLKDSDDVKLPIPFVNVINGGAHANNKLEIQEVMIVPFGFDSFADSIRCASELFALLKQHLSSQGVATTVGDEGGIAPNISSVDEALDLLTKVIEGSRYKLGEHVCFALDCAANELYRKGKYCHQGTFYDADEWLSVISGWVEKYPIVSIEDGFAEDDWSGWQQMVKSLGSKVQCIGDDLFVTNHKRIGEGIDLKLANAVLIKPNQVGTLSEAISAINVTKNCGWQSMLSHRSGDTEDIAIADICVGMQVSQIKTGSTCRSERTAKYNRLLEIEKLDQRAQFTKVNALFDLHLQSHKG